MVDNIEVNKLYHEDCIVGMDRIEDKSIDLILTDLPYGSTKNRWDVVIPFDSMWKQYNRIIKDNGAILLFCDGMFMADLMVSNKKMWRYNLVWNKVLTSGFLNANRMPLRQTEEIAVFYKKLPTYNPQKTKGRPNHKRGTPKDVQSSNYNNYEFVDNSETLGDMKHPTSLIQISKPHPSTAVHPTQKPVELLERLIKTYTNEGEIVLDSCAGSGSTIIAAINTNRNWIAFESNEEYYSIATNRCLKKGDGRA